MRTRLGNLYLTGHLMYEIASIWIAWTRWNLVQSKLNHFKNTSRKRRSYSSPWLLCGSWHSWCWRKKLASRAETEQYELRRTDSINWGYQGNEISSPTCGAAEPEDWATLSLAHCLFLTLIHLLHLSCSLSLVASDPAGLTGNMHHQTPSLSNVQIYLTKWGGWSVEDWWPNSHASFDRGRARSSNAPES